MNTKVAWYIVEIMLTKTHHICISVPRVMAKLMHFSL
jgi:hypothetical protein